MPLESVKRPRAILVFPSTEARWSPDFETNPLQCSMALAEYLGSRCLAEEIVTAPPSLECQRLTWSPSSARFQSGGYVRRKHLPGFSKVFKEPNILPLKNRLAPISRQGFRVEEPNSHVASLARAGRGGGPPRRKTTALRDIHFTGEMSIWRGRSY
jgi:hypothetical protein